MDLYSLAANQLGKALTWTGAARLARLWRATGSCLVLVYHEVGAQSPFCGSGSAVSSDVFTRQMRMLRRDYVPVTLAQLSAGLAGEAKLPPRAVHVTFDDGYRSLLTQAAPVLGRHGIPASVYVCPAVVDGGVYWWDDVCEALRTARAPRLRLDWAGTTLDLDVRADHEAACATLRGLIARGASPYGPDESVLRLREALGSPPPARRPEMLAWHEIVELARLGVAVGSHTMTHARLADVADEVVAWELAESRRRIESQTGQRVLAIAYPYGSRRSYDARALTGARAAGYVLAFSGRFGIARATGERFDMPRVPIGPHDSDALFAAKLSGAYPVLYASLSRVLHAARHS